MAAGWEEVLGEFSTSLPRASVRPLRSISRAIGSAWQLADGVGSCASAVAAVVLSRRNRYRGCPGGKKDKKRSGEIRDAVDDDEGENLKGSCS